MSLWLEPAVFPVLLDSCVLYPYGLRDLLLEIAHEHLYGVHRSPQILEDTVHNLLADARTTPERASRFCSATKRAFPEALVEPPSGLADELGCDPGDRHVLAAAIAAKAELIVTLNASGMGLRFWCLNFGKRWMVAPTGVHRAGGERWIALLRLVLLSRGTLGSLRRLGAIAPAQNFIGSRLWRKPGISAPWWSVLAPGLLHIQGSERRETMNTQALAGGRSSSRRP